MQTSGVIGLIVISKMQYNFVIDRNSRICGNMGDKKTM